MFSLHNQGAVKVITGHQVLNRDSVVKAKQACEDAITQGQPRLVFDLQGVPLIDSEGIELLLDLRDRCAGRGGALHLAGPTVLCRDILMASGVASQFALFDDVLTAVGSFAQ
jgi:anti-sigma B factor antagonist